MEYTISINVTEQSDPFDEQDGNINYDTVILVEAEDIESAESKVIDWFDRQDSSYVRHIVEIIKTLPKIH